MSAWPSFGLGLVEAGSLWERAGGVAGGGFEGLGGQKTQLFLSGEFGLEAQKGQINRRYRHFDR